MVTAGSWALHEHVLGGMGCSLPLPMAYIRSRGFSTSAKPEQAAAPASAAWEEQNWPDRSLRVRAAITLSWGEPVRTSTRRDFKRRMCPYSRDLMVPPKVAWAGMTLNAPSPPCILVTLTTAEPTGEVSRDASTCKAAVRV